MSSAGTPVAVVALFTLASGVLAAAWLRGRLGAAAIALFVVACLIWAAAFAAIAGDYRDADGFLDCSGDCSTVHHLVALGYLMPPLLISLSALGMIVAVARRRRRRRQALTENHS